MPLNPIWEMLVYDLKSCTASLAASEATSQLQDGKIDGIRAAGILSCSSTHLELATVWH